MLSEPERLAYLESLGITQYIAAVPIPHGLSLPQTLGNEYHKSGSSEPDDTAESGAAVDVVPISERVIDENPTPDNGLVADIVTLDLGRLNKGLSPPQRSKPIQSSQPSLKFALQIIATPKCRLVVELGLADSPGLSALESNIISDLLLALGVDRELSQHRSKHFRWPLVDNPMIAADSEAAQEALISFLAGDHPHDKTVFLGKLAPHVLSTAGCGDTFTVPGTQGQCMWTHSLASMQMNGSSKAEAWQHLSFFLVNN